MKNEVINNNYKLKQGNPQQMGATVTAAGMHFAFIGKANAHNHILLYSKGTSQPEITIELDEHFRTGSIYAVIVEGISFQDYEYNYCVDNLVFTDPYAKIIRGNSLWGKSDTLKKQKDIKAGFYFNDYNWEDDRPLEYEFNEIIMYALHVRGYTNHSSSGVKHKGTFEGVIEKIPYLKELGINQIVLMPAYEFQEVVLQEDRIPVSEEISKFISKEQNEVQHKINYWGFVKGQYFAPKASYTHSNDSVKEFKNLVKQMHQNGIEVIMQFYFAHDINRNLIVDCIRHWVMEYHIDGVHLNGDELPMDIIAQDPLLSRTKILYQGFSSLVISTEEQHSIKHLAEYNEGFMYDMRKYLKSDADMLPIVASRIRRNPDAMAVINYIAHYNGLTLADLVSYDMKHNQNNGEDNKDGNDYNHSWNCGVEGKTKKKAILALRKKQIKNALALVFLSQGTPMLLSGDENCHTQLGNNNAYCQDNAVSWLNWKQTAMSEEIYGFTKQIIALRKKHPILHKPEEMRIMDYISCGYPDMSYHGEMTWYPQYENYNRHIGIMYCGKYAKTDSRQDDVFFYVAYNMHWEQHAFSLPTLPKNMQWHICMDTGVKEGESIVGEEQQIPLKNQNSLAVADRTIVVLTGK